MAVTSWTGNAALRQSSSFGRGNNPRGLEIVSMPLGQATQSTMQTV